MRSAYTVARILTMYAMLCCMFSGVHGNFFYEGYEQQ